MGWLVWGKSHYSILTMSRNEKLFYPAADLMGDSERERESSKREGRERGEREGRERERRKRTSPNDSYLVDPASSICLSQRFKPCMSKYKHLYTVKLQMAH